MKFALLGGDDRFLVLRRLLIDDGHEVEAFALEKAADCRESAGEAAKGADCVILPLPCVRDGALNAPYSEKRHYIDDVLSEVSPGTPVCAGQAEAASAACAGGGLPLHDYFAREDFTVLNANLTAEGALGLILRNSKTSLTGKNILICGFGRIGKLLALKLLHLGACVTVAARSDEAQAWAKCFGCAVCSPELEKLGRIDFAVNTVPRQIFGKERLQRLQGVTLMELASPPYGFVQADASALGMELILAPGLPGVCTPVSAGGIIRDIIYKIMEESK